MIQNNDSVIKDLSIAYHMLLLFTTTSTFQQGYGKDVSNCFEEHL
jgi:hypothetical protein